MTSSDEKKETKTEKSAEIGKENAPESEAKSAATDAQSGSTEKSNETAPKGNQPRSTASHKPAECTGCGKAFPKKMWYYKNNGFYCSKRCYQIKAQETAKKAEQK